MKRNWDTVREILLATEELVPENDLTLRDFDSDREYEIAYHVKLLIESGLLDATISETMSLGPKDFSIRSLTWKGHEFLDAIRDDTIWNKTKSTMANKGASMTFELIKGVALSIATKALGL